MLAELENNIGISEKTLAEFIIKLAEDRRTVKEFQKVGSLALCFTRYTGVRRANAFLWYKVPAVVDRVGCFPATS